jgi:hypothetical protein
MDVSSPNSLGAQWQRAASELGIACQSPYTLVAQDGSTYEFEALLPDFGKPRGMLLGTAFDEAAANAAIQEGFGFSCLDALRADEIFELSAYVECLRDWGWAAKAATPPPWYGIRRRGAV